MPKNMIVSNGRVYSENNVDTKNKIITFDSRDELDPAEYEDFDRIESEDTHKTLMQKISTAARNVRYLWKLIGNTDISPLPTSTITGALSALNTDMMGANNELQGLLSRFETDASYNTVIKSIEPRASAYLLVVNTTLGAIGVYIVSKYHPTHAYSVIELYGSSVMHISATASTVSISVNDEVYFSTYLLKIGK